MEGCQVGSHLFQIGREVFLVPAILGVGVDALLRRLRWRTEALAMAALPPEQAYKAAQR
jgi:hypothetical protein